MPFTFSHPAIVLPLTSAKLRLSATGLIVGSIIPDFEYFLRMKDQSKFSHTLVGVAWFDLPLAVLVCFIYHEVVRNSLFDNLPSFLKERFIKFKDFHWTKYFSKYWIIVCISILIGTFTHLLWDDFTHETKFFVRSQPELSTIMRVGKINLAGYRFLQFASSLVGGLVIIVSIISLKRAPVSKKTIDYAYWASVAFISLSIMLVRFIRGLNIHEHRVVIVSFISSLLVALILSPILLNQEKRADRELSSQKGL